MAAAAGLLDEAAPVFSEKAEMVENGGVLTALPCLVREGLPGEAARHLRLPKGYYGLVPVLLFLAFLFLARTRNPERLRYQPPGEWGRLLGLDRCPEVKTLRRKIKAISADGGAVDDWQRSLAGRLGSRDGRCDACGRRPTSRSIAAARATCRRSSCRVRSSA